MEIEERIHIVFPKEGCFSFFFFLIFVLGLIIDILIEEKFKGELNLVGDILF